MVGDTHITRATITVPGIILTTDMAGATATATAAIGMATGTGTMTDTTPGEVITRDIIHPTNLMAATIIMGPAETGQETLTVQTPPEWPAGA